MVNLLLKNHLPYRPLPKALKHPATPEESISTAPPSLPRYHLIPSPLLLFPTLAAINNTICLTSLSFRRFLFTASQKRWWKGPLKVTSSNLPLEQDYCPQCTHSAMTSFKQRLENLQGFHNLSEVPVPALHPPDENFFSNI